MKFFDWLLGKERPAPQIPEGVPGNDDVEAALKKAEEMVLNSDAPAAAIARVLRIASQVRAILPRLSKLGLDTANAYIVVATATNYLPESVAGYLALPRDWADTRPVANGKSSLLLLIDQLDLLSLTMSRMYDAANRADAKAFAAHGAFLQQKFGAKIPQIHFDEVKPASDNPLDLN